MANKMYIGIMQVGDKFIVHPADENAFNDAKAQSKNYIWYYASDKPLSEFAKAGTFSTCDSYTTAIGGITKVDASAVLAYRPPLPPTPD